MTIKKFCLMTEGRSGSTSIMEALEQYGDIAVPNKNIKCPDNELVHLRYFKKYCKQYSKLTGRQIKTHNDLIEAFFEINSVDPCHYAGFKSMPNRHPDYDEFVRRDDILFITLKRRDIVSSAASFMVALAKGSWRRHGEKWSENWKFDPAKHGESVKGNLVYIYESHVRLDGIPGAIRLFYEDICDPDYQNSEINEFFMRPVGIRDPKPPTSGSSYISNWDDFTEFVEEFWSQLEKKNGDIEQHPAVEPIPVPGKGTMSSGAASEDAQAPEESGADTAAAGNEEASDFSGLQAFCLFVGYPVSGSTLIMSMLNAHPDVVIGHETDVLKLAGENAGREELLGAVVDSANEFVRNDCFHNNISYVINNQWQGRIRELRVAGADRAGVASMLILNDPEALDRLKALVRVPLRYVHVYRNPYDNIATMVRTGGGTPENAAGVYFSMADAVRKLKDSEGDDAVFDVCMEDFIRSPDDVLRRLCGFLGVEAGDDYVQDCLGVVFKSMPPSRNQVNWSAEQVRSIREAMAGRAHLQRYLDDGDVPAAAEARERQPASPPPAARPAPAGGAGGQAAAVVRSDRKRIVYAWELGMDLGHILPFLPLALQLRDRGYEVIFAIRDLQYAETTIGRLGFHVLQAPLWLAVPKNLQDPPLNYTEIILRYGFLAAPGLKGLVKAWRTLFQYTGAELVVADHAPSALLAAHTMGLKRVTIGTGFCAPPRVSPLPNMRPWVNVPEQRLTSSDDIALRNTNSVIADLGGRPLKMLADLFQVHAQFLCTFPELDHYAGRSGARYWGASYNIDEGTEIGWPEGDAPAVFVYLKTIHRDYEKVLEALSKMEARVLAYVPGIPDKPFKKYQSASMKITRDPVKLRSIMPDCRLAVCHAGAGTVAAMLLAGIPLLLLPTQLEQLLLSKRVEEMGAGLFAAIDKNKKEVPDYPALLGRLVGEPGFREAAGSFAEKYKNFRPAAQYRAMAGVVEELLKAEVAR